LHAGADAVDLTGVTYPIAKWYDIPSPNKGRTMRRREREITDRAVTESILEEALVLRIGLVDDDGPYILPVCFGYRDNRVYIHSAHAGRKMDILKKDNRICFETEVGVEVVPGNPACKWTVRFRSVVGFGKARIVDDRQEKIRALDIIMEHYSGRAGHEYHDATLGAVAVIAIDVTDMTGKESKE
jgi:nitroimidazol reductase NimA-like FMN-containing flavoprotein (pyridoxamine 5'-phosphate oxidase superfamily)